MTTEITSFYTLNVCSVYMYYRFEVANSPFSCRDALNLFIFPQKCSGTSKSCSLCCTVKSCCCRACLFFVRMSLVGEKETSGQGTWRHFPGRETKAALLDLQQGKHINVCEGSLGTVQNAVWTYWSVCSISRLIRAMATCYIRFNLGEGATTACYKTIIDGFRVSMLLTW